MNKSKKLAKNDGIGQEMKNGYSNSQAAGIDWKKKILITSGILVILVLCLGICYIQLRPRTILKVTGTNSSGGNVTSKVYAKDAMMYIYQTETQYNQYESLYRQMYGTSFWEMEDADGKGHSGAYVAKKQVMNTLRQREIFCMEAEKEGIELTKAEIETADATYKTMSKNFTDIQKKKAGLDQKTIEKQLERDALASKYQKSVIADANINEDAIRQSVSKDDYHQYDLQYYMIKSTDDKGKTLSKAQLAKNLAKMEDLKKQAEKGKKDFEDLVPAKDSSSDDETVTAADTDVAVGEVVPVQTQKLIQNEMKSSNFLTNKDRKKLIKLKTGEISDVIEGSDGYYLVRMENDNDMEAYESQCESQIQSAQDKAVNDKYSELQGQYTVEVTKYWKNRIELGSLSYTAD